MLQRDVFGGSSGTVMMIAWRRFDGAMTQCYVNNTPSAFGTFSPHEGRRLLESHVSPDQTNLFHATTLSPETISRDPPP
jgi:hypothetical protein